MKLSEMKQAIAASGIRLTKSLGQNFLHDANQLRRIVAAAELVPSDKVLEIGPGLGPLTEFLLAQTAQVLAIEKDEKLFHALDAESRKNGQTKNLCLIHDDALAFIKREQRDWDGWKLVANLPYSVASPIIVELALAERGPERMVVTLQSEVARRLTAQPGHSDYGVLTLLVQLGYEPRLFFKIPASCFFPEPDVDSACVSLVGRPKKLLSPEQKAVFVKLVKRGFSQRRKMMMKLLKQDWTAEVLATIFAELNIPIQTRAEDVSLEQFVALAIELEK
jgi:16S rRNA (adenine1518-N6/adenine1519-N6)-dimethyltransferase